MKLYDEHGLLSFITLKHGLPVTEGNRAIGVANIDCCEGTETKNERVMYFARCTKIKDTDQLIWTVESYQPVTNKR